ncbi:helix-turn-helix domain-containing protein [Paenibacillus sp. FSL H8-0104]|uniref:helix-turn-helix domain-containing protein n=1 Tax=Paenibacillus sp. FSL H8-0104 TaxID=2954509 RepID=UPI0030FDDCBC
MNLIRKIDVEGRIVIPINTREILMIDPTCNIIIKEHPDGLVLFIQRNYCVFCGSTSKIAKFKVHEVCKACIETIGAEAKHVPKLEDFVYEEEVSPAIIRLKELLKTHPDIKQYEMARILGVSKPRVSQLMKKIRAKEQ